VIGKPDRSDITKAPRHQAWPDFQGGSTTGLKKISMFPTHFAFLSARYERTKIKAK
jgi:hypothetical protein